MGLCSTFPFCQGSFETTISWGQEKIRVVSACLISRMKQWQSGDLVSLWIEARREVSGRVFNKTGSSLTQWNVRHALFLSREGRYADAMQSLRSKGCALSHYQKAFKELHHRHPYNPPPTWSDAIPPPLCVTSVSVLEALKAFPRASSPRFSKLRAQHLSEAVLGSSTPSPQECLESLTRWVNLALSENMDRRITTWLTGAPLTAIYKKQEGGGTRPIAVGETLRRMISRVCCSAVKSQLPDVFLP